MGAAAVVVVVGESGIVEQRDLDEFSAPTRGMLYKRERNSRGRKERDVVRAGSLISGNDRTSLHPPLHTHTHTHTHTFDSPAQKLVVGVAGIWYLQ